VGILYNRVGKLGVHALSEEDREEGLGLKTDEQKRGRLASNHTLMYTSW